MDLIISTAQGDAEVSLSHVHESVTVADIVRQATGRPSPSMVRIDGRMVSTSMVALGARLFRGSRIEVGTEPTSADAGYGKQAVTVTMVQVGGSGSGHRCNLTPGRYRIGVARRGGVGPLSMSTVADPRFELDVKDNGEVWVSARHGDLDGAPTEQPQRWTTQHLRVGSRVFRLEAAQRSDSMSELTPDRSGRAVLHRIERPASSIDAGVPHDIGAQQSESITAATPPPTSDPANWKARGRETDVDIGELVRRGLNTARTLWERRADDQAAFEFSIGFAPRRTMVATTSSRGRKKISGAPVGRTEHRPVTVNLLRERGVGFVGERSITYAAARSLIIQACALHGPADLDVVILTSSTDAERWEWVKWLPHSQPSGDVQIIHGPEAVEAWCESQRTFSRVVASLLSKRGGSDAKTITLAIIDDAELWTGRTAPLRSLFADVSFPVRFVTLAEQAAEVPPVCTSVVRLSSDGTASLEVVPDARVTGDISPALLDVALAEQTARRIGRLLDPDIAAERLEPLATSVSLLELLDLESLDGAGIRRRWRRTAREALPPIPIGEMHKRAFTLDLASDGPHVMITAAPGSGRRDLLRTIALAMAASAEPNRLNFLFVDGGSGAFRELRDLAHTAGFLDDLDDHLAYRALRSISAEVQRRRNALDQAGAISLAKYQQLIDVEPLPHLLIMIDDVSTLVARSAEFMPSLLELCRTGQELGIHLITASSRPAGPIDKRLRAFSAAHISLRVATDDESLDIVGVRDAAYIPRQIPGRGLVKIGAAEPLLFQSAYPSNITGPRADPTGLAVVPYAINRQLTQLEHRLVRPIATVEEGGEGTTDMHRLIGAINAAASRDEESAIPVLAAPLPKSLDATTLRSWANKIGHRRSRRLSLEFGLVDVPDEHRHDVLAWSPSVDGNLLVLGEFGSGTSSALVAIALDAAANYRPEEITFDVIDGSDDDRGHDTLVPLQALLHCRSVVSAADADKCREVIDRLHDEILRRSSGDNGSADGPTLVLLIDNIATLLRSIAATEFGADMLRRLHELLRRGPDVGVVIAIAARREGSLTAEIRKACPLHILLRDNDDTLFQQHGIRDHAIPTFYPGRGMVFPGGLETQLVRPPADLASALARRSITDLALP
jgi:DNA segregation ATPase FtsK/SpoIIIE, S-DNA-T family